ncbi:MAG: formate dehydrogenase subunit alpha, partial [Steroidobacteraceae bacterium]
HVVIDKGATLADSSCVTCGACVDACPTGALADKTRLALGEPSSWTRTTCTYCGVGCELQVGVREGRIVQVQPDSASPVSKGHLCVKGRYAWDFGRAPDRITQPLMRRDGQWTQVTWDEALAAAATGLRRIIDAYGPDAVGVLGSARATNEENYLVQKFARIAIGTNNVDCCARVCHMPTAAAMKRMLGTGAATNSFDDIEQAATILISGCNPTEAHPVIGARIKQQVRRGARLIVIDPRRIELAGYADVHLALRPGTNVPLLLGIAHVILQERWYDWDFVRERVSNFEAFRAHVAQYTPPRVAEICGVRMEDIRRAARLYATAAPSMCFHGLGMTEHLQGTEGVMTLVNLALLTGNLGKPGTGINPLRGQNNVQGAAVMGCEPSSLTGGASVESARERFESHWHCTLPRTHGLNVMEMIDAAAAGNLKVLYIVGYDILSTLPDRAQVSRALERVEAVVVQDLVMTETAREFGTLFLPAATAFEKDGTFMNAERRIERVRKVVEPPGGARTDAWITCELARRMNAGQHFAFADPSGIWDEVRSVWFAVGGISYSRLEKGGLQWPCPDEQHPGTQQLHAKSFAHGPRAALACIPYVPTQERTDAHYPWLLNTGRNLYQFNAGTMTARTANNTLRPHDTLDIAPEDAERMQIEDGSLVRVYSRYGEAVLPARKDVRVKSGELFATFHDAGLGVNRLTGPTRDRLVSTPEYKVTAVRIEPCTAAGVEHR